MSGAPGCLRRAPGAMYGHLVWPAVMWLAALSCVAAAPAPALGGTECLIVSDDEYFVVWLIDPATGTPLHAFSLPGEAMVNTLPRGESGLAYDGTDLYYTSSSSSRIWVLDPVSGAVRRTLVRPAMGLAGLAAGGGRLWGVPASAAARGQPALLEIDTASGATVSESDVPGASRAAAASLDGSALLLRIGDFEVRRIDAATGAGLSSIVPPPAAVGLAASPTSGLVWTLERQGRVHALDPATGEELRGLDLADGAGNPLRRCGGLAIGSVELPQEAAGDAAQGGGGAQEPPAPPVLDVQDTTIIGGFAEEVPILLSTDVPVQGFVVAALHDPGLLALEAILTEGTRTSAFQADFAAGEILPNGGTLGVVFDLFPPFENNELPPGENQTIALFRYRCIERDLPQPETTEIRLTDGVLGTPPRDNIIVHQGLSISPELLPGRITCLPRPVIPDGPGFFCGGPPGAGGVPDAIEARSGERTELCFFYSFPEEAVDGALIQGVSMGLVFDCRLRCIEDSFTVPADSITAQIGADFVEFNCDNSTIDGDGCEMVLGIVADTLPPFGDTSLPPASTPLKLACVEMEIGGGVDLDECLDIRFRDGVNGRQTVPVKNLVTLENESVPASTAPCQICVTEVGPTLLCGAGFLDERDRPAAITGAPGDVTDLCFWYTSPGEEVTALTEAIRFDCRLECIPGTLRVDPDLVDADLVTFQCDNDLLDGDGCEMVLTVAGLPDQAGAGVLPAANLPRRIGCVDLAISDRAPPGSCLAIQHHDGTNGTGRTPFVNQIETAAGPVETRTRDCLACVLPAGAPTFLCGGSELGPDGLPVPIENVERGERAELCLWYTSPIDALTRADEIQAVSMAISYDCNLSCIEDTFRIPPDSATALVDAEFVEFHCDNDPADGDGCEMVLGIVVDLFPPVEGRTLPPTDVPLKLGCVEMEVGPRAKLGFCLDVRFQDGVNGGRKVPVKNIASIGSIAMQPQTEDCQICVAPLGPRFLCGGGELGADGLPVTPGGRRGEPSELCFWYDSPEHALQGLVMGLEYDCRLTCVEDSFRIPEDTVVSNLDPDFIEFRCDSDPDDGDGCQIVFGLLVDAAPPFDGATLPPSPEPVKVACVDFLRPEDSQCDECFAVGFENDINGVGRKVNIFNLFSADNQSFLADTVDCEICTTEILVPVFRRGDCNFDESVEISDAAEIVSSLFGIGTWRSDPVCDDACDANDDGRLDLADAISLLHYLFTLGPEPPPPGPHSPGPDPTEDKIDCDLPRCP